MNSYSRRILISGATIAGSTAAWWLSHLGHHETIVEEAPLFRTGGQNIDVRGVGRKVLNLMGLEKKALDHGTGEKGTAWVRADDSIATKFLQGEVEDDGPTAELEILRGDLATILFQSAEPNVDCRFGVSIESIDNTPEFAEVRFTNGIVEV